MSTGVADLEFENCDCRLLRQDESEEVFPYGIFDEKMGNVISGY